MDGEKAKRQVKERADHFAADFNREIQNAYFNFQTGPADWRNHDWTAFNERYDFWREKTSYPGLISGFYYINKTDGTLLKYDTQQRAFLPSEPDAETEALRSRLSDEKAFSPVHPDLFTLVMLRMFSGSG